MTSASTILDRRLELVAKRRAASDSRWN